MCGLNCERGGEKHGGPLGRSFSGAYSSRAFASRSAAERLGGSTYLAILLPGFHVLVDVRLLRMLRIFRILKLPLYFDESQALWRAFVRRRRRILVFLGVVLILVVLLGTVMSLVEGQYRTRPGLGLGQENDLTSSA
jgi:hypothetical protein